MVRGNLQIFHWNPGQTPVELSNDDDILAAVANGRGTLSLPKGDDADLLAEELVATHWEPNREGKLKLEEKAKIAARLGRSPDRANELARACIAAGSATDMHSHAAADLAGFEICLDAIVC